MEFEMTVTGASVEQLGIVSDKGDKELYKILWFGGQRDVWVPIGSLTPGENKTIVLKAREWKQNTISVCACEAQA